MNFRRWAKLSTIGLTVAVLGVTSGFATAAASGDPGWKRPNSRAYTFAVIGDIPYGDAQLATFPDVVAQINADPDVSLVSHLGDIKSGSTQCTNAYFDTVRADFDAFEDPLVYTPGDNEWTDCHRLNNGGYNPLERLDAIRGTFFDRPRYSLGQNPARLITQARTGYPENVRFTRADVSFGSVHIVGSNNGLAPWTGATTANPEQTVEVLGRTASTIQVIRDTFAAAKADRNQAVVLFTQADMFDPTVASPTFASYYAFQPIVAAIAQESAAYSGPVYLFNGDSHVYNDDEPLAAGSTWLDFYGLDAPVPNLNRVTIDGSADATNYLKVTIRPRGRQPLTWTRIPFTS